MSTNIKKTTILTILFLLTIIVTNTVFAEGTIDVNAQILEASNNGLIQGLCFVYDLITGGFGKLVMCFFVVGLGWGFLIGEVKDHKTIFTFILAIAITFGGVQFAHFISGNDYSCATFHEKAYLDKNTIYNSGICPITDITEYIPGEVWRVCNTTIEEDCKKITSYAVEVDNNTSILDKSNNYITLYDCPEGYLKKDSNNYIIYKCNETGLFSIVSDINSMENGKCLPACSIFNLKTILSRYNFDGTNIEIVENSGYINENYYSADTKINVQCRNDLYTEYLADDSIGDGAFLTCVDGNFVASGSCKPQCDITKTKYNSSTATWKKCNDATCSTTTPVADNNFYYNEIVEVDTCKSGYFLNNKTNKLRLQCGNSGSWVVLQDGQQCSKTCDINNIEGYINAKIGYCSADGTNCTTEIEKEKTLFFPDETIGIYECNDGFEVSYSETDSPALFVCKSNGTWENTNKGGLCEVGCNINQIQSSIYTSFWKYFDYSMNKYVDLSANTKVVKSGYKIKADICISGYSVNPYKQTIYTCKNGKFNPDNRLETNVCKPTCNFATLKQLEQMNNVKTLVRSSYGGRYIDEDKDKKPDDTIEVNSITDNSYSKIDSYYTIQSCFDGYSIEYNAIPIIFRCDGKAEWEIFNKKENFCKKNCLKKDLPIDNKVLVWGYTNNKANSDISEFTEEFVISGSVVRPKTCLGGYNIDSFNTSYYLCDNGIFVKKNLNDNFTVDNICTQQPSL